VDGQYRTACYNEAWAEADRWAAVSAQPRTRGLMEDTRRWTSNERISKRKQKRAKITLRGCALRMCLLFCPSRKCSKVMGEGVRTWLFNGTSGRGIVFYFNFMGEKKEGRKNKAPRPRESRVHAARTMPSLFSVGPGPIKPVPRPFLPFFTTTPPFVNVRPLLQPLPSSKDRPTPNDKLTSCPAMISWCVLDIFASTSPITDR
jgi:hypothetical protein